MGKYMRKAKTVGDVAVMEIAAAQSSLGVRTRAKTLALQRLQQLGSDVVGVNGVSYLQLRSRKLEKPPLTGCQVESKRQRVRVRNPNANLKNRGRSRLRVLSKFVDEGKEKEREREMVELKDGGETEGGSGDGKFEAFVAENSPDFDARDRSTMKSTPCSFIKDSQNVGTPSPGSTSKASSSDQITKRMQNSASRLMHMSTEMEEFFDGAEKQQHSHFIEKYNFDPVEEKPLPGRYDWVKSDP